MPRQPGSTARAAGSSRQPWSRASLDAGEVAAEALHGRQLGSQRPRASACAMGAARANSVAISAFDCLRIAAKGATRATVNLCPVYTAVEPKYHRRRSGALLLSGIGFVFPGQRPDEGARPFLKARIEQDLMQLPSDVSAQLSIACASLTNRGQSCLSELHATPVPAR